MRRSVARAMSVTGSVAAPIVRLARHEPALTGSLVLVAADVLRRGLPLQSAPNGAVRAVAYLATGLVVRRNVQPIANRPPAATSPSEHVGAAGDTCSTCRFGRLDPATDRLRCRRLPPAARPSGTFPVIGHDDWCADHERDAGLGQHDHET